MELVFMPKFLFFAVWLQLTFIIMYRGAMYGDAAHDLQKNLKVWEFYREDTRPATKLLLPCIASWVIMWFFLTTRIPLGVSL